MNMTTYTTLIIGKKIQTVPDLRPTPNFYTQVSETITMVPQIASSTQFSYLPSLTALTVMPRGIFLGVKLTLLSLPPPFAPCHL